MLAFAQTASPPLPEVLAKLPPSKVVLTIGTEKITAGQFRELWAALMLSVPEASRAQVSGPGRKRIIDNFIKVKVMEQEAKRRGLDRTASYEAQMAVHRSQTLAGALYESLSTSVPLTNEVLRRYYDQHKNEFNTARAFHILIRFKGSPAPIRPGHKDITEQEALAKANEIRKKLLAGADFAQLARTESDDAGSGVSYGGDLGTIQRGRMSPAFDEAIFTRPLGQVGPPVKTEFGYHVVKCTQREFKTFEQAKADIDKKLRPEEGQKVIDALRQKASVVIAPELGAN
jgi:hypothetical protein